MEKQDKKNIYFGGNCESVIERPFQSLCYIEGNKL